MKKVRNFALLSVFVLTVLLSACSSPAATAIQATQAATVVSGTTAAATSNGGATLDGAYAQALTFNNAAWQFDSTNNIYWQIGVVYTAKPAATAFESLAIYVPGQYVNASANSDGKTYTLTINSSGTLNGYTASTAPIVMPVNTPGYSEVQAPTAYNYSGASSYLQAGFIYVEPGLRGRQNGYDANGTLTYSGGAPWGVTDFKAAVRFLRYNKAVLPGSTDAIFAFGMSGGGAQTAIIGASGDSELYTPYLESIGAAMVNAKGQPLSDAVAGAMAWCPITSLDYADEAYEWNMGQFSTTGTRASTTWTSALSDDLATAYADYINKLGLKDANGKALTLEQSSSGIYLAGSYYDYLISVTQQSLNNFLADTTFPYTASAGGMGGFPGGGQLPSGGMPPSGQMPSGGIPAGGSPSGNSAGSTTYATVQDYIAALNKNAQWVTYDAATNTTTISSLEGFVNYAKNASKAVPAFDALDRSQAENNVFGNDTSDSLHFDPTVVGLLTANETKYAAFSDWDASLVQAYATDLTSLDKLGNSIQYRMNMYNPMYYLLPYYEGYQKSTVASYWRINTGIDQGDTANTVEVNLVLALQSYTGVKDVEFTTVWGLGHTMAERSGDSTVNFITWVNQVEKQ